MRDLDVHCLSHRGVRLSLWPNLNLHPTFLCIVVPFAEHSCARVLLGVCVCVPLSLTSSLQAPRPLDQSLFLGVEVTMIRLARLHHDL